MSDRITVWGIGTARAMRVHWMLHESDLKYECRTIGARTGETQTPAYLSLNAKGKIPVFQHGGFTLSESVAIIRHIGRNFELPEGFFVPANCFEESRLEEWCAFIAMELDAHPLYTMRRHGDLKHIYGDAPEAVDSAREYFLKQLNAVVPPVLENNHYLMGDDFSVADILLTTCLDWAHGYDIPLPMVIMDYRQRVSLRPAYLSALKVCYPKPSNTVIQNGGEK